MIKRVVFITLLLFATAAPANQARAAGWAAIIKAVIERVVKAVDLMIQRRQNSVIRLQNAQKALENTMSKLKLDQITEWVSKQRELYRQYYDELKKVKSVIAYYFKIKQIAEKQLLILDICQKTAQIYQADKHFSQAELSDIRQIHQGILQQSAQNTDLLLLVVKSFSVHMTDAARLQLIEQTSENIDQLFEELISFNQQNQTLSLSRARSEFDTKVTRQLYGID
ncbi:conjugal transfer protein TraI [Dyadobacter luteus]|uniref:Conjugal transfer protein TraI n=1 Tax=Dyadobacter luteus TaxID=2259619 RepID=A0A3D8Y2L1_9BACT|nr:conjugal transfer protein TraI [Dyadobacter luteus]REA55065.1 conjugal transfer protein TraI [Dyadobacter luteus]